MRLQTDRLDAEEPRETGTGGVSARKSRPIGSTTRKRMRLVSRGLGHQALLKKKNKRARGAYEIQGHILNQPTGGGRNERPVGVHPLSVVFVERALLTVFVCR